jgi:hypothetical protein
MTSDDSVYKIAMSHAGNPPVIAYQTAWSSRMKRLAQLRAWLLMDFSGG